MITTVLSSVGTVLTTGGLVIYIFKRQQKLIDSKVSKDECKVLHQSTNDTIKELKKEQKANQTLLHEVHVMVERIDARMNGT